MPCSSTTGSWPTGPSMMEAGCSSPIPGRAWHTTPSPQRRLQRPLRPELHGIHERGGPDRHDSGQPHGGLIAEAGNSARLEATLWGNETDWAGAGAVYTGTVNIRGDPAFADPDAGDYHIGPGSAAVDSGITAGVTTT